MSGFLEVLHAVLRAAHIGLGFAGLALFWVVIALPKGSRAHVLCGKWFSRIAFVVGGTALFSSTWALVHLDSFAPFIRATEDATRQAELREIFRFIFSILLFLSSATIAGAVFGIEVMRKRDQHEALRKTSLVFWELLTGASALGLIAFGVYRLATSGALAGGLPWAAYQVPSLLGLFGVFATSQELRYVYRANPEPRSWLYKHVEQMCGTGVAFHTAFIVFGASRMFGFQIEGAWALVPWVGPPMIGIGLTSWYVRRLKRRHGNDRPSTTIDVQGS